VNGATTARTDEQERCHNRRMSMVRKGEIAPVKLLVQPGEGIKPLLKGITSAKKSIEIVIFRFDEREIEQALAAAVGRGVAVQALIAHTNRAGEESLRKLELRLLAVGVTVARTADDLVRYHAKYMIIDRRELFVMAFNFTHLDILRSRSFAIITRKRTLVAEAAKLFEADTQRQSYESGNDELLVSPTNSRRRLAALIQRARKELLIYDLKISDDSMIRLLEKRAKAGVSIRVIGRITRRIPGIRARKLSHMRLHARTIVVDGKVAFLGSQSLREIELDSRREVGIVFREPDAISALMKVFEDDWAVADKEADKDVLDEKPVARVAKKAAKVVAREIPGVLPLIAGAVRDAVGDENELDLNPEDVQDMVKSAVKEAVEVAIRNVVEEAVGDPPPKSERAAS
jgi:cardiolipin synthase A/B